MVVSIVNCGPIEDHRRNPARVDVQQNTVTPGNSAHRGSPLEKCGTAAKPYRVLARSSKRRRAAGFVKGREGRRSPGFDSTISVGLPPARACYYRRTLSIDRKSNPTPRRADRAA